MMLCRGTAVFCLLLWVCVASSPEPSKVFSTFQDTPFARRQRDVLESLWPGAVVVANSTQQQVEFLQDYPCVNGAAQRFNLLNRLNHSHLAEELWKYCALWQYGGIYVDAENHIIKPAALKAFIAMETSFAKGGVAVLMDSFAPDSIHGSLLMLRDAQSKVALEMATLMVNSNVSTLIVSPLLLPEALYGLIVAEPMDGWYMLQQSCSENPFRQWQGNRQEITGTRNLYECSPFRGLCCFVYSDGQDGRVAILGSRNPIQPILKVSFGDMPTPFQPDSIGKDELPFVATVKIRDNSPAQQPTTFKTFYEHLHARDCLPSQSCNKCLSDKKHGATCETCLEVCTCYCKALCKEEKDLSTADSLLYQEVLVRKPLHWRDPTRLIPRVVHQTWFEDLDPKKYPNMSRLMESFKASGWTYYFYTDERAEVFLSGHFPPQVRQAYDLLQPGAFKADLFRYCCLLIYGGVYADVDTMTGPSLDAAIPPDAGFMVGLDEPGKKVGKRMCLWNGFIASIPGHPFLAKVIESVVNAVHLRYSSVDVARDNCPSPEMSIITSFGPLFVAGPCILGSTINKLLGHHGQASYEAGDLTVPNASIEIPGRTIMLNQNKLDMGAHRFSLVKQNLIVLSTDFPDSDDREKLDNYEHYSETRVGFTTYGIEGVYKDKNRNYTALIRVNLE